MTCSGPLGGSNKRPSRRQKRGVSCEDTCCHKEVCLSNWDQCSHPLRLTRRLQDILTTDMCEGKYLASLKPPPPHTPSLSLTQFAWMCYDRLRTPSQASRTPTGKKNRGWLGLLIGGEKYLWHLLATTRYMLCLLCIQSLRRTAVLYGQRAVPLPKFFIFLFKYVGWLIVLQRKLTRTVFF